MGLPIIVTDTGNVRDEDVLDVMGSIATVRVVVREPSGHQASGLRAHILLHTAMRNDVCSCRALVHFVCRTIVSRNI